MSKLYLRGNVWWLQSRGKRSSTGCLTREAAELWALTHEQCEAVMQAIRGNPLLREAVEAEIAELQRKRSKGYIYAILVGAEVKLGFTSRDPGKRLRQLQTGQAPRMELVALASSTRQGERDLHRALAAHRIRGEWFDVTAPAVQTWIEAHRYAPRTRIGTHMANAA